MPTKKPDDFRKSEPHLSHLSRLSPHDAFCLLKRKKVEAHTGYARSTLYERIAKGLYIKPVSLGGRAVAWPAGEVLALNAARIAGKSDNEIRALVAELEAQRVAVLQQVGLA